MEKTTVKEYKEQIFQAMDNIEKKSSAINTRCVGTDECDVGRSWILEYLNNEEAYKCVLIEFTAFQKDAIVFKKISDAPDLVFEIDLRANEVCWLDDTDFIVITLDEMIAKIKEICA